MGKYEVYKSLGYQIGTPSSYYTNLEIDVFHWASLEKVFTSQKSAFEGPY